MNIRVFCRSLLALSVALFAHAALAQTTHLNVSPKQIVTVQVNPDTSTTPPTQIWSEWLFGVKTSGLGAVFTVPKGKTLVITDLDFTVQCTANSTAAPIFAVMISDPSGTPLHFLTRLAATRLTPGREQVKGGFTSGVVIPEGYLISKEAMQFTNHLLTRGAILGYYVE